MKQAKYFICLAVLIYVQGYTQISILKTNGNIGLGTINPEHHVDIFADELRIRDKSGLDRLKILSSGWIEIPHFSTAAAINFKRFDNASSQNLINWSLFGTGGVGSGFFFSNKTRFELFGAESLTSLTSDPTLSIYFYGSKWPDTTIAGNLGVGTNVPTEKLHVLGNIKASGTITPSDLRLKKILKNEIQYGLKEVMKINPVRFEYNGKGGVSYNGNQIGLIAQELQKVAPDLVQEYTHITYKESDKMGLEKVREQTFLEIRDSEIKYLLINAIKEQQAIIDRLENRIIELEDAGTDEGNKESIVLELSDNEDLPVLLQNTPNPTDNITSIHYYTPHGSRATIDFVSMSGQVIKSYDILESGKGELQVDISNIPSGTYKYSLIVNGKRIDTKTMGVIK